MSTTSAVADDKFLSEPGAALPRASAWGNVLAKSLSVPVEKASRLLLIAVAAPIVGEVGFGRYQYADAVTAFLVLGTDLGLGIWTTRALVRAPERAAAIVGTGLWIKALAAVPYLLLVAVAAVVTHEVETRQALALLGVATLAESSSNTATPSSEGTSGCETRDVSTPCAPCRSPAPVWWRCAGDGRCWRWRWG